MSQATKKSATSSSKKSTSNQKASVQATQKKPAAPVKPAVKSVSSMKSTSPVVRNIASEAITKSTNTAIATIENAQKSTKAVVSIGADKIKEIFASTTNEAQKTNARAFDMGREGAENVSRTLDAFERTVNDVVAFVRQNFDIAVEVNNIVADIARNSTAEIIKNSNNNFSGNLDVCNELFGCKNINDALEIGNKLVSINVDTIFSNSVSLSELFFQLVSEASEPVNEHILESAERFGKTLAA